MIVGVDVGFSAVKALTSERRVIFPSVVGAPIPEGTYSLNAENGLVIKLNHSENFTPVGQTALLQSQYTAGRRDSTWVLDREWCTLFVTALSELSSGAPVETAHVVLGLPVYDWTRFAQPLHDSVVRRYPYQRRSREPQVVSVGKALVITQPYGSLLDLALSDQGRILNNVWSTGLVAVADLGGNTMNLLVANALDEVRRWTTSNEFGLLHALDNVRERIRQEFPRFNPATHEIAEWLAIGAFRFQGAVYPIWEYAKPYLESLIHLVVTRMDEIWPESSRFDAVLLTGGGSAAIGKYLRSRMLDSYANVSIAEDPRWANVSGYHKLALQVYG